MCRSTHRFTGEMKCRTIGASGICAPASSIACPLPRKRQQLYFPFYPLAFEQFDFSDYDLVLSNKSGFCHGVITGPETLHICYCLTPTRYVWRYHQYAEQENLSGLLRAVMPPFLVGLRQWDRLAADRVDHFIAISQTIRQRIAKIYRRDSVIIYPPVDTSRFAPVERSDDYYLIVGRSGALPADRYIDRGV